MQQRSMGQNRRGTHNCLTHGLIVVARHLLGGQSVTSAKM